MHSDLTDQIKGYNKELQMNLTESQQHISELEQQLHQLMNENMKLKQISKEPDNEKGKPNEKENTEKGKVTDKDKNLEKEQEKQ